MLESELQSNIRSYLKARGAFVFKVHVGALPGSRTNPAKGCPDLVCVLPGGLFLGVEVKALGKRKTVSDSQRAFHSEIRARGGHVLVADSLSSVADYLDSLRRLKKLGNQ